MTEKLKGREVIFEFRPIGNIMRVMAMDVASMTEVVVQCPLSAGEAVFKQMGMQKLEYMLKKNGAIK